jgi:TolB-like protein/Tfp pilus assembly protein PilF
MIARNFFAELKRRNVYKVAVAYAVVGWLLIQVATQVFPFFEIPNWAVRLVVLAIMLGFPVALVIAWAFELTPEGLKRTEDADAAAPTEVHRRSRGWIFVVIVGALLSAGLFLLGRYGFREKPSLVAELSAKSIAVLPFANLSSDKENAFFAEGIQDEILTRLAKIGALKVISRTSTAHYASSPQNLTEIARQLGVANILEGSVQKAGDSVHINVQLIRAATDEHLWAESYNRKLIDIFNVEGEVAGAIADQLNTKLSGNEKASLAAKPTNNPAAYEAYLRGLAFEGRVDALLPNILNSIAAFAEAVRLDPEFALAWAHLARQRSYVFLADKAPENREAARTALETAVKLRPDAVETQLADGYYHYWIEADYEGAKNRFEAVRERNPNNPWPFEALAAIARRQGEWEKSVRLYAQAIELDPQNLFLLGDVSLTYLATRDLPSLQKIVERAHNLSPENSSFLSLGAIGFQMSGDLANAQAALDRARAVQGDLNVSNVVATNAILSRKYEPAIGILKSQLTKPETLGPVQGNFEILLGDLQRHAGDAEAAATSYRQAQAALLTALQTQSDNPDLVSALAWTETWLDDKTAALSHARKAIALLPASKDAWTGPQYEENLARIEAHFGDKENAITALQHLLEISYGFPPVTPALLRLDPDWDNLRGDPRFDKLATQPLTKTK